MTLALVIAVGTSWLWIPTQTKWQIIRSFDSFWEGLTEDWDDKGETLKEILGVSDMSDGAKVAAACADCDVCEVAQNRFFHKYDLGDVKEIMREGGESILKDIPPQFIDIRSVEDYIEGHIPVSINMPLEDLKYDIWPIRRDTPIVIIGYEDTDYIALGKNLVDKWFFYNAGYLVGGMAEWDGELESFE